MTTTINASPTNGLVYTADGSGIIKLQSNGVTTNALAWVNFNGGNGNTAGGINSSYNVSSITVNSTGDYTVNFTNSLGSTSYAAFASGRYGSGEYGFEYGFPSTYTATALNVTQRYYSGTLYNAVFMNVVVFGN